MSIRTFNITVEDEEAGSQPLTEQATIDYIIFRLEAQSVLRVTKIESEEK
jgi:CRISPR/Cas system CMR-associated protein Cmr5 small subunit